MIAAWQVLLDDTVVLVPPLGPKQLVDLICHQLLSGAEPQLEDIQHRLEAELMNAMDYGRKLDYAHKRRSEEAAKEVCEGCLS